MGTVQQLPVQGNPTTAPAATLAGVLREVVDAQVGPEASFAQREAAALALANDATRLFLQDDLLAMVDRYGEHIEVEGACYKRHELGTVRYYTLCGTIDLERWTYRAMGVHNGPTVVPVDLEAGLVERTTPALGARIMLGYAKNHMRSAEEDMQADHRCPPSRSTLERVAKAMGTAAQAGGAPDRTSCAAGGAGAGGAPSPSCWGSTARPCPWKKIWRTARHPSGAAQHRMCGRRPLPSP